MKKIIIIFFILIIFISAVIYFYTNSKIASNPQSKIVKNESNYTENESFEKNKTKPINLDGRYSGLEKFKSKWKTFLNKIKKLENNDNSEIKKEKKEYDESTIEWARKELPNIGKSIVSVEKEISRVKDKELKKSLYTEYYEYQQEYYNMLDIIAPAKEYSEDIKSKMNEYLLIKRKYEEKGELSKEEKEKLANIKRKIFYND